MIIKRLYTKPIEGCYGEIFIDEKTNTVVKVFKKRKDLEKDFINNVYNSELEAYEILKNIPGIIQYIPKYYGKIDLDKILDIDNKDISENYYLDFNFKLEYISGHFQKYGNNSHTCEILKKFKNAGISYVKDCSAVLNEKKEPIKIIDFATKEYVPKW